jgi:hypothetical protein
LICSKKAAVCFPNRSVFWQIPDISVWAIFMRTTKFLLRNQSFIRWRRNRRQAIDNFLMNVFWSRTSSASWRFSGYWVKGTETGANAFHSDSILSLQFTTLNLRAPNDLLLQEVYLMRSVHKL